MAAKLSLFMPCSQIAYQTEQLLWKKFFDSMFSLENYRMTAFWPKYSLTLTFYVTFSNSIPNWTTFVKEVFDSLFSLESDETTALWPNDSVTFTFYRTFSNRIPNRTFVKDVFFLFYGYFRKRYFQTAYQTK